MSKTSFSSRSGFSLVEMAVILAIVAVIIGVTMSAGKTQIDVANMKTTKDGLANIKQALLLFRDKQGRFPCPALETEGKSSATYGQEQAGCDVACPVGIVCMNNAAIGFVPFKALGLDENAAYDGWGGKITYAVDIQQTGGSSYASGTLQVVDSNNNKVTASPAFGDAIFVLLSHGPDRKGAYSKTGNILVACDATTLDGENCNGDDIFRTARFTNSTVAADFYDDFVTWYSQDKNPVASAESTPCLSGPLSARTQKFSAGEYNGCYIGNDNRVYCWGSGAYGALAQGGSTTASKVPIAIGGGINDWISISTGWRHACGIRANGHLYCWGRNWDGQLGIGTTTGVIGGPASVGVHSPTETSGASCSWSQVSASSSVTCGIQTDGRLYCWGRDSDSNMIVEPTEVSGGHTDWIYVDSRSAGGCGIRGIGGAGSAYCWGNNPEGELGDGTNTNSTTPVLVKDTTGSSSYNDWTMIGTEGLEAAVCGIRSNGTAYCWGGNQRGQLGYGTTGGASNLPKQVVNTANSGTWSDWSFIEGSKLHSCGVRGGGLGYCWGWTDSGRLGNGVTSGDANTPRLVLGGFTDWVRIDPQYSVATCGYRSTGAVYCWGDSWISGLLGNNQPDNTVYSTPQAVPLPKPIQ